MFSEIKESTFSMVRGDLEYKDWGFQYKPYRPIEEEEEDEEEDQEEEEDKYIPKIREGDLAKKLLDYNFRVMKYPYHRCFSYFDYGQSAHPSDKLKYLIDLSTYQMGGEYPPVTEKIQQRLNDAIRYKHRYAKRSHTNVYDMPPLFPLGGHLGDRAVSGPLQFSARESLRPTPPK